MYLIIGGDKQEYGPSTAEELRLWISEGRLNHESLAREESSQSWRPLSQFPEFDEALKEQSARFGTPAPAQPSTPERPGTLSVADCLVRGWQLWKSNFAFFFAATFMVWTIMMALQFLPLLELVYWPLRGVLYGGLCIVFLKRLRGQAAHPNEVFSGFGGGFIQLVLVGMLTSMLTWLGFFFCVIPGIYFGILWIFSIPAAADKQVEFWPAMELSRKAVSGQWSKVFVLVLIAFLPVILITFHTELKVGLAMYEAMKGVVPASGPIDFKAVIEQMNKVTTELAGTIMPLMVISKVILLLNLPFGLSALLCAYEDLLGTPSKRRD